MKSEKAAERRIEREKFVLSERRKRREAIGWRDARKSRGPEPVQAGPVLGKNSSVAALRKVWA